MPLLYFTVSHLLDVGADVLQVDYAYDRRPDYRSLAADERQLWLLADVTAAWRVALAQRRYRRFTLIGLSLGTRALPVLLAAEPCLQGARTIWFSPVWHEEAVGAHLRRTNQPTLVVIGTADPLYNAALVSTVCAGDGNKVVVVPDADHGGLEVPGDVMRSVRAVEQALRAVQRFTV
jgi:pimeloyl-ACP methyl ester carboxylesterase